MFLFPMGYTTVTLCSQEYLKYISIEHFLRPYMVWHLSISATCMSFEPARPLRSSGTGCLVIPWVPLLLSSMPLELLPHHVRCATTLF